MKVTKITYRRGDSPRLHSCTDSIIIKQYNLQFLCPLHESGHI